jgi:hypothetical protein
MIKYKSGPGGVATLPKARVSYAGKLDARDSTVSTRSTQRLYLREVRSDDHRCHQGWEVIHAW